ncbi:MAG: hypothetical protein ABSG16_18795 [Candidatus Acidiferrum sp.]
MSIEVQGGVTLRFSADERLAAAAGGVARYYADAAGMEGEAVAKLQRATVAVCLASFAPIPKTSDGLSVEITRFADRIEVAVTRLGGPAEGIEALPGIDRIDRESRSGSSIIRLTKSL